MNCAGYNRFGLIMEQDLEAWRDVVEICLTSVFLGIKHQAAAMTAGGSIINIASLNARQPPRAWPPTAAPRPASRC